MAANIKYGYWDRQAVWDATWEGRDYSNGLIVEALNNNLWKSTDAGFTISRASSVYVMVDGWMKLNRDTTPGGINARMICELMAPALPNTKRLNHADASRMLARVVDFVLPNWHRNTPLAQLQQGITHILGQNGNLTDIFTDQTASALIQAADDTVRIQFLRLVAWVRKLEGPKIMLDQAVILLISMAKRGTVSEGFLNKITNGINADVGKDIAISGEEVSTCWRAIGPFIDDTNVEIIINRWLGMIPAMALRIRLTLQQIPGEGLTSIMAIHKAYTLYNDFRWDTIEALFPAETQRVIAALRAVNGNKYYGYKKDLGVAKSTNFPNFAYVAKELLIKVGGETALARARCWTRRPERQAEIDTIVADYEQARAAAIANALQQPAGQSTVVGAVQGCVDFYSS